MANLVMGAMGNLVPKLYELLKDEYKLQTGVKERIRSLTKELEGAQAALCEVGDLPWDQVDKQVRLWAGEVREASYDMEDVLDTFLVRGLDPESAEQKKSLFKPFSKVVKLLKTGKVRREISGDVENIMTHLQEVTERCRRYKVHDIVARPAKASPIDPRLHAMYNKVQDLVGIDKSSGELISKIQPPQQDGASNLKMKIVSVVGVGGLGKTTLAKAVYDKLKGDFNCGAFVPVGRNPDLKKVLKDILREVDEQRSLQLNNVESDERQLINELRLLLKNKRYFIVIDDVWEVPSWEHIKLAIGDDNNCGARIVITTRIQEVAKKAIEVYKLRPLPEDSSRELFFTRIGVFEGKLVDNKPDEVTVNKFLKKCGGIPLAIITMASLLVGKPRERWLDLYSCIGFGSEDNDQAKDTMRIVSFSYYDLPAHLRTCLLYLSAFPEDSVIRKDSLVWMWVAEGFVKMEKGMRLFETGEGYFYDLINRSMLEAVKSADDDAIVTGCRVHDMVLDFIRSMSEKDNFFSVVGVLDNDQSPLPGRNNVPRRLAHHNMTIVHGHRHGDDLKMAKAVRSMLAIGCGIEASDPFYGFTLLRVLVLDNCNSTSEDSFDFQLEDVTHLLHLRFLSTRGTHVMMIPKEIGRLRFLQTLDLKELEVDEECFRLTSLPEKLMCLRLPWTGIETSNDNLLSLTRLTSLEELSISVSCSGERHVSWHLPTELRVLELYIYNSRSFCSERDFWECVHHLNKLEHLTISGGASGLRMQVTDVVLPSRLRHFDVALIRFCKMPSCVNGSCLADLSHLELSPQHLDERDLKMLGSLPELSFLCLGLLSDSMLVHKDTSSLLVSTVVVVSEKDDIYFPKLRYCKLVNAMISFHANEEDKSIWFHVWDGGHLGYMPKPSVSVDKLQNSNISCSTGGGGGGATRGAPRDRIMPCLEVLRFTTNYWSGIPMEEEDNCYCDNIRLECGLPSLREIFVRTGNHKITAAVRRTANAHPNHPVFHVERM